MNEPKQSSDEFLTVPRLGIIHIMAWTAAMAVLMKYWMALNLLTPDRYEATPWVLQFVHQASRAAYYACLAAGIVGTSILMLGTFRGSGGRMHPGHRLVFINTAIGLLALPTYLLAYIRPTLEAGELPYGPFESVYWFHLAAAVVSIPSAMLYLHAAAKSDSEGKRWQVLFVGYGLFDVSHIFLYTGAAFGLFHIIGFVFPLEAMLKGIVLCLTVLFDLVRKRYVRDWIHWLGVAWASMNIAQVLAGKAAQIVYEHFTN